MRCDVATILIFGVGIGLTSAAAAADYGPLRGSTFDPPRYRNWEGFYVGGQVGTGGGGADFSGEGSALINHLTDHLFWQSSDISSWLTAGKADTGQELQYGAFIGYNMQWGDVVLGVDASYNHTDLSAIAAGRTPASGYIQVQDGSGWIWPTAVSGESYIRLKDFGTIRGRAGWAVGSFLPYVTGGLALGRASYGTTATVAWTQPYGGTGTVPWTGSGSMSASDGKSDSLIYGWSAGIGMDVALTQNIFLRGEYEFIQFSQSKLNLNNARAGLGIKF